MLFFLLIILPAALCYYCATQKDKRFVMPLFFGIMTGILLCSFKFFFFYTHRIVYDKFIINVLYLFLNQMLLPCAILYGAFFVCSKDTLDYKGKFCYPLLLSFYAFYLPYSVITSAEGLYTFFSVFVKPVLFLVMINEFSYFVRKCISLYEDEQAGSIAPQIILCLISLAIPAILEGFIIIDRAVLFVYLISLLYVLAGVIMKLKQIKASYDYE